MSRRQHSKGRKRPRSWHRSKTSQYVFANAVRKMDRAFKRAES